MPLDSTSVTQYDRQHKHKKHKYLWQINNTLNIRNQIFSLTSSERCFFRLFFLIHMHTDSKIIKKTSLTRR